MKLTFTSMYLRQQGSWGIIDNLRFKAIFLQCGSNKTKKKIAIILSNIIGDEMHTVRYENVIIFLTK